MTTSFYTKDLNDCWGAGDVKVPETWADNTDIMNSGTMLGRRERRTRDTGHPVYRTRGTRRKGYLSNPMVRRG